MEMIAVYVTGGLLYGLIELLWRGWTHWSMLLCGGACFALMYQISLSALTFPWKCLLSACVITAVEFVTGCLVNIILRSGTTPPCPETFGDRYAHSFF